MFISELEKKTGLTRHTIRFYEKEGFLENYIRRGENNYRDYSEDAVVLLLNIKAGQAAGFTLAELKELVEAAHDDNCTIPEVDRLSLSERRIQWHLPNSQVGLCLPDQQPVLHQA